jgi:hypothetical protein
MIVAEVEPASTVLGGWGWMGGGAGTNPEYVKGTVASVGETAGFGGEVEMGSMGMSAAAAGGGNGQSGMLPRPSMGDAGDWTGGRREIWGEEEGGREGKPRAQEGKSGGE